ncbi:MAG: flagellar hook-length control protein FliK [Nocardioides sp.]
MSTLSPPVLPVASSTPTSRTRDRARGDASNVGGHDFAAVLDGHLAASKKPGGSKAAGATRDDREARDAGKSDASASAAGAAGQTANPAATATADVTPSGAAAVGAATDAAMGTSARATDALGGQAAQGLLAADGNPEAADASADGAGAQPEGKGTAAGKVAGADDSLAGSPSAETGNRAGEPTDQSRTNAATGAAAGGQVLASHGAGDSTGTGSDDAGTAVETISLVQATATAGSTAAQAGRFDAEDEGKASDGLGQLTTPAGVTAAPTTTKPDGAQGAAPTTAAPATPVVAQVSPAVARVVSRGDGEHRMMLKLHPADLGEIHLTVTVRGDHVDVDIAAGSQARDLLRDGSAHLRSLLESIGRSPGQLVLRDLPSAPAASPATTTGGAGPDTGSGAASYAGDGTGRGDTGRDQPGTRGGASRPEPLVAPRDASTRTTRTTSVLGGSALDVTV